MQNGLARFAPAFIQEQVASGLSSGRFGGAALVADIPGFTSLTETYIRRGPEGAERLSVLLGEILGRAAEVIGRTGGFVAGFAGDAITGVFPGRPVEAALEAAGGIHAALSELAQASEPGSSAKVGVSEGGVDWLVASCSERLFYCFRGEAILAAAGAQETCPPVRPESGSPPARRTVGGTGPPGRSRSRGPFRICRSSPAGSSRWMSPASSGLS